MCINKIYCEGASVCMKTVDFPLKSMKIQQRKHEDAIFNILVKFIY